MNKSLLHDVIDMIFIFRSSSTNESVTSSHLVCILLIENIN